MGFNSYEELKAAVEARRKEVLTLEVPITTPYSAEHEAAKQELAQAKGMKALTGGAGFLGDNIAELEQRVADTKPEEQVVWVQYSRLDLGEWRALTKAAGLDAFDQYERVLPKTFMGVFGEDPAPDPEPEGWVKPEPLTTNGAAVSSKGNEGILPGGALHGVVQAFIAWQNAGGDVTIRPTKSGLV
jgi:hypothetical protein